MFDFWVLLGIALVTIILFFWVFMEKNPMDKFYYGLIVLCIFIYSGAGGAIVDVDKDYKYYYFIYMLVLSFSILATKFFLGKKPSINSVKLDSFIEKYADWVIYLYIFLTFLDLCYPDFLLDRLINPPLPDVLSQLEGRFQDIENKSTFTIINYYLRELLTPFYFFCLYKYRADFKRLLIYIGVILYLIYCRDSYIGRGTLLVYGVLYFVVIYTYNPKYRKRLFLLLLVLLPSLAIFFVSYSRIRIGGEVGNIVWGEAFEILLYQETSFPEHFNFYKNISSNLIGPYLTWLVTLPFPGFFKSDVFAFNSFFSEQILGVDSSKQGFYILLPSVVGEAYFIFGKNLFWIHGIIYGVLISSVRSFLRRNDTFIFLSVYIALILGYYISRGGTFSG